MTHYECSLPCNDREPATATEWRERVREVTREAAAKVANVEQKYAFEVMRLRSELAQARAQIIALRAARYDAPLRVVEPVVEATGPAPPPVPYGGAPSAARAAKLARRRTHA